MCAEAPSKDRPSHIAIIMDGNGRWAEQRNLPRIEGHRVGVERLREIVTACLRLRVRHLTVFAFSTENWRRTPEEVKGLMTLLAVHSASESSELIEKGVRVVFIGDRSELAKDLVKKLTDLEERTRHCARLTLTVAVNYGGRAELTCVIKRLATKAETGELQPSDISEDVVREHTYTAGLPDPDLIIRTSGEMRLSNFLLWQAAYAELEFVETLWPDFTPDHLREILNRFLLRNRRFGAEST